MKKVESLPLDDEVKKNNFEMLKKDYDKKADSYDRWYKITSYLIKNEYFNKQFDGLDDMEMLKFVTQYISAPFPPMFSKNDFDKLVLVGINNNQREALWRLSFTYAKKGYDLDKIVDYYIAQKGGYYIQELNSAVGEYLNINELIDKIKDK